MKSEYLSPCEQIVMMMRRIYETGMTTLSGGNLSIRDEDGAIWITPAATDKGNLVSEDIVCVQANGTAEGRHRPSSEFPFHRAIYTSRPDFKAIVHAHPPALVAFSIAHIIPEMYILPRVQKVCGRIGYAPYALTGSEQLGVNIASTFATGAEIVILENHGAVAGGETLQQAFARMEMLDFCARTLIQAQSLGPVQSLDAAQIALSARPAALRTGQPEAVNADHISQHVVDFAARACNRLLMTSAEGVLSARVNANTFVITPADQDLRTLEPADLVTVHDGVPEEGKTVPSLLQLHTTIYRQHPQIASIINAQPPSITAYAVTGTPFDTRTIPESYIMLRDLPAMSYGAQYTAPETVAALATPDRPVLLIQNEGVLTMGRSVLEAFDRLEVAEYSARSLIDAGKIGRMIPIGEEQLEEMKTAFNLR